MKTITKTLRCAALIGALWATAAAGENTAASDYARERLAKADRSDVAFRVVPDLGHEKAFRVTRDNGKLVVEHQAPAGALYGAQPSWGSSALKIPTPEVADYYRYVLGRYFVKELPSA